MYDEAEDFDSADFAYGYKVGEEVTYKGFLRARIKAFDSGETAHVELWDPDAETPITAAGSRMPGNWSGRTMRVSINDCE